MALNSSSNYIEFEKLYQTLKKGFHAVSKLEAGFNKKKSVACEQVPKRGIGEREI